MIQELSANTKAILLLTAPLIVGRGSDISDLLKPSEYKRLAIYLREIKHQPADFVSSDSTKLLRACQTVIDEKRLQKLLARGFALSQAIERWQSRAIWVVSRADPEYPRRLKNRLREDAPAVLYGCGDRSLLESGGLAVVGSRHVDDVLIDYTMSIGQLAARSGVTIVSGGAKGIDQAAMRGALEAGGKVCGVLADKLERTAMNREHRNLLLDGQLVLVSPFDPSAGFNVGNAMQRNKLIYALAEAALVVSSDLKKGGTWSGATEQLEKFNFVPVYIRSTGEKSEGLDALQKKGAFLWPNPQDEDNFNETLIHSPPNCSPAQQAGLALTDDIPIGETPLAMTVHQDPTTAPKAPKSVTESSVAAEFLSDSNPATANSIPASSVAARKPSDQTKAQSDSPLAPADILYDAVRTAVQQILKEPMKDIEVASALGVSIDQANAWLKRLEEEGMVEKRSKPVRYELRRCDLFPRKD